MLYIMNIAKMVFPLFTLPYLTRILQVETYAIVSYVKAVMQYVHIILMFGFGNSATKMIVRANGDKDEQGRITGGVLEAKGILSGFTLAGLLLLILFIPLLRENIAYTLLAFLNIVITEMVADFLFRGVDRMEVITIRFMISKIISTVLTFVFLKNDSQILMVPLFDILGSAVALLVSFHEIKKMGIRIRTVKISYAFEMLKESAVYFFSNMATTAFGALNTILVGIFATKTDVSYWSNCMQLVTAVQGLYAPINSGVYPTMVRTKSFKFLKKVFFIVMPVVIAGCIFCYFAAEFILATIFGVQYIPAVPVFRMLIPVLLISFPAMLFGWPALDPIDKHRETTITTVISAIVQVFGLFLLILTKHFTLINIAVLRGLTEILLLTLRSSLCFRYRNEYLS